MIRYYLLTDASLVNTELLPHHFLEGHHPAYYPAI